MPCMAMSSMLAPFCKEPRGCLWKNDETWGEKKDGWKQHVKLTVVASLYRQYERSHVACVL